jgi:hypothetical protein
MQSQHFVFVRLLAGHVDGLEFVTNVYELLMRAGFGFERGYQLRCRSCHGSSSLNGASAA